MNAKRFSYVMIGVLVLIGLIGGAAVYFGNKILTKASNKLVSLKLENRLMDEQQIALKKANADIEKYADLYQIAQNVVPQDKDQARAVLEIVDIAKKSGMTIDRITFPSSNLGGTAANGAPKAPTTGISQAKPVPGLNGVYSIDIVVEPAGGDYPNFLAFLEGLENNRRTAQVSIVNIHPQSDQGKIIGYTYQLTVSIFIKPGSQK